MPNLQDNRFVGPVRPMPLIPIYAFTVLSALTLSLSYRFEHLARTALLGAAFFSAAIAVASFARFLLTVDESLRAINYWALAFGFVSFSSLELSHGASLGGSTIPTSGFVVRTRLALAQILLFDHQSAKYESCLLC